MVLVAGLGNPENRYLTTRHNTGFLAVDRLAERHGVNITKKEGQALTGTGMIGGTKVLLCKPQTWMNESGISLRALSDYYRLDPVTDIIVIVDDVHLPTGQLRLRKGGSAGGHNGLKSIISHLGTDRFPRIRVGVGETIAADGLISHVLGHFDKSEWPLMDRALGEAADAVEVILSEGMDAAMNRFNRRVSPEETADEGN